MDTQKTIIRVLELFRTLAILFGISLIIFAATAFYYINQDKQPQSSSAAQLIDSSKNNNSNELSETATKGQTIFKEYCAQCHSTGNDAIVGPGLQGIQKRRDVEWLRKWIRNPQKVLDSKDKYAIELYNKFNKTQMSSFWNFTDEDIDAILKYVEEVGNRPVAVL